jgi:hypothetical protein
MSAPKLRDAREASRAEVWVTDPTLCPECGREACEDHLPPDTRSEAEILLSSDPGPQRHAPAARFQGTNPAPKNPTNPPAPPRLTFSRANDLIALPRPVEIVEGVASAGGLTALISESGTGKTFVMTDLSAVVSSGVTWHGRAVLQGSVAYASYEGDALGLRFRALRDVGGHRLEHVYVLRAHDPLSPRVGRDGEERSIGEVHVTEALVHLAAQLTAAKRPPIVLLCIDTVRASLAGSEDSSEDVAAYLRAVRRIMTRVPGAAALLAHHAGWQDGDQQRKRERGSSAWRGNCDTTLYLEAGTYDPDRGEAQLTLRTLKSRDGEKPPPLPLIRRRVELAEMAADGGPVTSCVIDSDRRSREDREAERVAAVEATDHAVDLAVLRAMQDYPAATNITRLRPYVGQRTELVTAAVARILRAKLALDGKRGQPYTLTAAGLARLNGTDK